MDRVTSEIPQIIVSTPQKKKPVQNSEKEEGAVVLRRKKSNIAENAEHRYSKVMVEYVPWESAELINIENLGSQKREQGGAATNKDEEVARNQVSELLQNLRSANHSQSIQHSTEESSCIRRSATVESIQSLSHKQFSEESGTSTTTNISETTLVQSYKKSQTLVKSQEITVKVGSSGSLDMICSKETSESDNNQEECAKEMLREIPNESVRSSLLNIGQRSVKEETVRERKRVSFTECEKRTRERCQTFHEVHSREEQNLQTCENDERHIDVKEQTNAGILSEDLSTATVTSESHGYKSMELTSKLNSSVKQSHLVSSDSTLTDCAGLKEELTGKMVEMLQTIRTDVKEESPVDTENSDSESSEGRDTVEMQPLIDPTQDMKDEVDTAGCSSLGIPPNPDYDSDASKTDDEGFAYIKAKPRSGSKVHDGLMAFRSLLQEDTRATTSFCKEFEKLRLKIVLVGDSESMRGLLDGFSVKKSSRNTLLSRHEKDFEVESDTYSVSAVTLSSSETPIDVRYKIFKGADIIIVCFSLEHEQSFPDLSSQWIPEVKSNTRNVPTMLLGTVTTEGSTEKHSPSASKLKKTKKELRTVKYLECDTNNKEQVQQVYEEAIKIIIKKIEFKPSNKICTLL